MTPALASPFPPGTDRQTVEEAAARLALSLASPEGSPDLRGPLADLYRAVLALFWSHADPAAHRHELCDPLTRVVARYRSRRGQSACADFAAALGRSDAAGALDACRELALLEREVPLAA